MEFISPVNAFDFAFKSFFTLRLDIPVLSAHAWHYLWNYIYKLTKSVKPIAFTKLHDFQSELNEIN